MAAAAPAKRDVPAQDYELAATDSKSQRAAALAKKRHRSWPHKLQLSESLRQMAALQQSLDQQWSQHYAAVTRLEVEKQELKKKNGGMKLKNRLKLSCGGVPVNTERSVLRGGRLAGTRLEALFSGRWEKLLLRDPADAKRIFLDCDASCFRKILESIITCTDPAASFRMPSVAQELEPVLACTLRFFGLDGVFAARAAAAATVLRVPEAETDTIVETPLPDNANWPSMPLGGSEEEHAQSDAATPAVGVGAEATDNVQLLACAWEQSASMAHKALHDAVQEHQANHANFEQEKVWIQQFLKQGNTQDPEVVQIDLLGDRVCTRRSTLMLCAESALARQFDAAVWAQNPEQQAHGAAGQRASAGSESDSDSDDDADVIYLTQNPYCFKKIVQQLQLISMGGEIPPPPVVVAHEKESFDTLVDFYFPGEERFISNPYRLSVLQ